MSNMFTLILEGVVKFKKYFKGGLRYVSLGTSALEALGLGRPALVQNKSVLLS
jgi:hypothetical protein